MRGAMRDNPFTDKTLADALCAMALKAGAAAMDIYGREIVAETKSDASPVTEADRAAVAAAVADVALLVGRDPAERVERDQAPLLI